MIDNWFLYCSADLTVRAFSVDWLYCVCIPQDLYSAGRFEKWCICNLEQSLDNGY